MDLFVITVEHLDDIGMAEVRVTEHWSEVSMCRRCEDTNESVAELVRHLIKKINKINYGEEITYKECDNE